MRIWVTGVGIVSALGAGADATMDALCLGHRAFGQVTAFPVDRHRSHIAAVVRDPAFDPPVPRPPGWSRTGAMAVAAAREALIDSAIDPGTLEVDLVVGGTTGPMLETESLLASLYGGAEVPSDVARALSHPLPDATDMVRSVGAFRRIRTISSACSTGLNAIMIGALWLLSGRSERVLVGASDSLCLLTYTGFSALGSLDPQPCRPFDRTRAGLSLGEGAAFLMLESDRGASRRGASPIAELAGWAAAAEGHHITNPEPDGTTAARVMSEAIRQAGIGPRDIDYVNAHGTATLLNDAMEIRALRKVLGEEMKRIAVSSSKGQIGHCLGAAGAIEAAVTALAISRGCIPPTGGLTEVDPECEAVHVIDHARETPVRAALTNSFGFGGLDSSIVFTTAGYGPEKQQEPARAVRVRGAAVIGPTGVLGPLEARSLAMPGEAPPGGPLAFDPTARLEASRARRLGRAERLLCVAMLDAMQAAKQAGTDLDDGTGLVAGLASGNLDAVARFLEKVRDKGPQFAPPADFPNLMLSATAGHASIYHRLRGPVLSATDVGTSVASALLTAVEMLETGAVKTMVAGGAMESSPVQVAALRKLRGCCGAPLTEGASALVLSAGPDDSGPVISWTASWHDPSALDRALASLPVPRTRCRTLLCGPGASAVIAASSWASAESFSIEQRTGCYEGVDGAALVVAASLVEAGDCEAVLVIASEADRGYGFLIGRS